MNLEDDFKVEFDEELQMLLVVVSDGMGSYERSKRELRGFSVQSPLPL